MPHTIQKPSNLLLVEDDPTIRVVYSTALEKAGHKISTLKSGVGIIEAIKELAIDLVVTDIVMENVDGIQALLLMKKEFPELPVIAISGNDLYLQSADVLGANAVLQKPFEIDALLAAIDAALFSRAELTQSENASQFASQSAN